MSLLAPRSKSNAISSPSGDQLGEPVGGPLKCVSCVEVCVSMSVTQISRELLRSDKKAILRPSGEKAGSDWKRLDVAIAFRVFGLELYKTGRCSIASRFSFAPKAHTPTDSPGAKPPVAQPPLHPM